MNAHVFIVDSVTFRTHLEYMFAGTGAGEREVPFLTDAIVTFNANTERMLVGMIADISRIRKDDKIIFYLQSNNGMSGMFFGVFKAASKAFFEENTMDSYLKNQLQKSLTFRIQMLPDTVYASGITEHEYLDSLKGRKYSYEMCWSMIYRKLKGNRGCTMITDYEYIDLENRLRNKNKGATLSGRSFTFDDIHLKICIAKANKSYIGIQNSLSIYKRLLYKANNQNAFETHLQAFVLQNIDQTYIGDILLPLPNAEYWIGNEVSCGVGMQRIDLLIKQEDKNNIYIKIIELKDEIPTKDIIDRQLPWYLEWVIDYVVPNYIKAEKEIHIIPCILAEKSDWFISIAETAKYLITSDSAIIEPTEYIGFSVEKDNISFEKMV